MCRTLYVAKTANIGYTTSMVAVEIRVPNRGMRQTDVHMEREAMGKWIIDIVRCKECKHAHMTYGGDCKHCDMWKDDDDFYLELYLDGDFYCAYGERKEKCKECWYWSEVHKRCENKSGCQFKPYGERKESE